MTFMRRTLGYAAVSLSALYACIWAYWGSIEMFHEGWFELTFIGNVLLSLTQYLSPMLGFMLLGAFAMRWPRPGAITHFVLAIFAAWFFRKGAGMVMISTPLALAGLCYWIGRPERSPWKMWILFALPLGVASIFGAYPGYLALTRSDDGIRTERLIEGNGVSLVWAPEGPGWPLSGSNWEQANHACICLNRDGSASAASPQNIWRLPTAQEVTASQVRHGKNAGGEWTGTPRSQPVYRIAPNRESPLWNPHSMIIYWWTSTEAGPGLAYRAVWTGELYPTRKSAAAGYYGYRCVRNP